MYHLFDLQTLCKLRDHLVNTATRTNTLAMQQGTIDQINAAIALK